MKLQEEKPENLKLEQRKQTNTIRLSAHNFSRRFVVNLAIF